MDLHSISTSCGAQIDYYDMYNKFVPSDMKNNVLEYICINYVQGRTTYWKVKYFDGRAEDMLLVFVYGKSPIDVATNLKIIRWQIVGVCLESEYSEDFDYCGGIRLWLNTEVEKIED